MTVMKYDPPNSVVPFLTSEKFISLIVGPVGSTKTTAGIVKIAYHAKKMYPCKDGIRRSRAIWIRNTREQLRDTSIPDFLRWFPDGIAGVYLKSEYKFVLKFDDVECEVLFRGLDDTNDVRRLLSLQASFGIMDEFREIHQDIYTAVQGRLGRYPSKLDNGVGCVTEEKDEKGEFISNAHLWGQTNPPDMDTFWEQVLSDPPSNVHVSIQPSGLSPDADWLHCLPNDYYNNLAEGKTQDYIDVYIHAKFGKSLSGQPVHRAFDRGIHIAKRPLVPIRSTTNPLIIGVDFGLTPAAVIGQVDPLGRVVIYDALVSEGMGILRFCREKLKPLLARKFAGMNVLVIGDPAGVQRAQTDERSAFDILKQEGFRAIPAKTNSILARINSVDALLTRMIDGKSGLIIDPDAVHIIKALAGGYRYKLKTTGEYDDKPEKNSHSHVADACQYFCLHANGNATGDEWRTRVQPVEKVNWTWV